MGDVMRMWEAYGYSNWVDFVRCPWCGMAVVPDDPEDFEGTGPMHREEDHVMTCPACGWEMSVHVAWKPTYPYEPERVE